MDDKIDARRQAARGRLIASVLAALTVKDLRAKLPTLDFDAAIHSLAKNMQASINSTDGTKLREWIKHASNGIGLDTTLDELQAFSIETTPAKILEYIHENPGQTAFYVISGMVLLNPTAVNGPLLKIIGCADGSFRAGSIGARLHRILGPAIPAKSFVAHMMSAGGGGSSAAMLEGVTRLFAAANVGMKVATGGSTSTAEKAKL